MSESELQRSESKYSESSGMEKSKKKHGHGHSGKNDKTNERLSALKRGSTFLEHDKMSKMVMAMSVQNAKSKVSRSAKEKREDAFMR